MAVNFEYYKVFYYVVKYQTISRAAQALHLTQPTVSHYIQALENELQEMQINPFWELELHLFSEHSQSRISRRSEIQFHFDMERTAGQEVLVGGGIQRMIP